MHVPATIAQAIGAMGLGPYALIALLALFYILLGFFLDGVSIVVMTLPITLPLALQAGFDPVWYGVFLVLMVELGLMTPPVGFNLFVLKAVTGRPLGMIARAAVPFFPADAAGDGDPHRLPGHRALAAGATGIAAALWRVRQRRRRRRSGASTFRKACSGMLALRFALPRNGHRDPP